MCRAPPEWSDALRLSRQIGHGSNEDGRRDRLGEMDLKSRVERLAMVLFARARGDRGRGDGRVARPRGAVSEDAGYSGNPLTTPLSVAH